MISITSETLDSKISQDSRTRERGKLLVQCLPYRLQVRYVLVFLARSLPNSSIKLHQPLTLNKIGQGVKCEGKKAKSKLAIEATEIREGADSRTTDPQGWPRSERQPKIKEKLQPPETTSIWLKDDFSY